MDSETRDWSDGARPMVDIDPDGPIVYDLPHRYLPDDDGARGPGWVDDGRCCQFTAGRARCQDDRAAHRRVFPALYHPRRGYGCTGAGCQSPEHRRGHPDRIPHTCARKGLHDHGDGQVLSGPAVGGYGNPDSEFGHCNWHER